MSEEEDRGAVAAGALGVLAGRVDGCEQDEKGSQPPAPGALPSTFISIITFSSRDSADRDRVK